MRWFISALIILGILGGSAYAINQRDKPVYVLDTRTAEYIRYLRPESQSLQGIRSFSCQGAVSYKRDILATAAELYARRG